MTGYHLSIGYLSGGDKAQAWDTLKTVVLNLCHDPVRIANEAVRLGMNRTTAHECARAFASASLEFQGTEDSTLRIIEGDRAEGNPQIMMLAGGSGQSRTIKEAIRRAFCRLVMTEMHRRDIEININVA